MPEGREWLPTDVAGESAVLREWLKNLELDPPLKPADFPTLRHLLGRFSAADRPPPSASPVVVCERSLVSVVAVPTEAITLPTKTLAAVCDGPGVLRLSGSTGSFMTHGASITSSVIRESTYDKKSLDSELIRGVQWAEQKLKDLERDLGGTYPWRSEVPE